MTEQEQRQQQEIERLQRKLKTITEAYSSTVEELNQIKREKKKPRRGRPGLSRRTKARILALRSQGCTMREIAEETDTALGTVCKIIAEARKQSRVVYLYLDREEPATLIDTYSLTQEVQIINFTDDMLSRAFGIRENPSWEDFTDFLESRCMPRSRYGIREELKYMGLDVYDPFQIVSVTEGRVHGDGQRLKKLDKSWVEKHEEILKKAGTDTESREELLQLLAEERRA